MNEAEIIKRKIFLKKQALTLTQKELEVLEMKLRLVELKDDQTSSTE